MHTIKGGTSIETVNRLLWRALLSSVGELSAGCSWGSFHLPDEILESHHRRNRQRDHNSSCIAVGLL